jgi:hypothetical protein
MTKYSYYSKRFNHCTMKWCIVHVVGEDKTVVHHAESEEEANRLMKLFRG